jgi:KEOPS complex subunit Cgi121
MSMNYRIYHGIFEIPDERNFIAKIREIANSSLVYVVFFERSAVAGCNHIKAALSLAERSFFEYKKPVSNFFEMEVLLYAFGTRQTGLASGFGIHRGRNDSIVLICSKRKGSEEESISDLEVAFNSYVTDLTLIISGLDECTGNEIQILTTEECPEFFAGRSDKNMLQLMEIFDITSDELEICGKNRIEELVIERCALLDVNR